MHRSYLYVPGDRPDRIEKALTSGSDAVIADLEDAVSPSNKTDARSSVARALAAQERRTDTNPELLVRVNNDENLAEDVRAVLDAGGRSIYLPKADVASLSALEMFVGGETVQVVALIESAQGLLEAPELATNELVRNLAIGEADLTAELAMSPSPDRHELLAVRTALVVASAAAEKDSPTGPVDTNFRDLDALRAGTEALRRMGFGARSAIHPAQVAVINEIFTPSPEEVAAARRLVELHATHLAEGTGAFVDDNGAMVDEAVMRSARRTLSRTAESRGTDA